MMPPAARHPGSRTTPAASHRPGHDLLTKSIDALASGIDLPKEQTAAVLSEIMAGNATEIQIAGFLIGLRMKGETVEEVTGCARAMRAHVTPARPHHRPLVDTAGTGGDGAHTFNISTSAALAAAIDQAETGVYGR